MMPSGSAFSHLQGDSFSNNVFKYKILPLTDLSDKTPHDQFYTELTTNLSIGHRVQVTLPNNIEKTGAISRVERDVNGNPYRVYFIADDDNKIYSMHSAEVYDDDEQIDANDAGGAISPINRSTIDPVMSSMISNIPIFEIKSPSQFKHKLNVELSYKNVEWEYWLGDEDGDMLNITTDIIDKICEILEIDIKLLVCLDSNESNYDKFISTLSLDEDGEYKIYSKDDKKYVEFIIDEIDIKILYTKYTEEMEFLSDI